MSSFPFSVLVAMLCCAACGPVASSSGGGAGDPMVGGGGTGGEAATGGGGASSASGEGGAGGEGGSGAAGGEGPCYGVAEGALAADAFQTTGDCSVLVCLSGTPSAQADDADVAPDPDLADCEFPSCSGGVPTTEPHPASTPCSTSDGVQCDGLGTCVECVAAQECVGHPNGPVCLGGHCGCSSPADCPAAPTCGTTVCAASACDFEPLAAGTTTPTCFPYVCDGTSLDCPSQCNSDADCAGQTCVGTSCQPASPCDLEWFGTLEGNCTFQPAGELVGVDAAGNITVGSSSHPQGILVRTASRYGPDGQQLFDVAAPGGSHTTCGFVLGPLGGLGSNCSYSYQGQQSVSFAHHNPGWQQSVSVSGVGSFATGAGTIDGADNVFWSALTNDGMGQETSFFGVFSSSGAQLPDGTPSVPAGPPQILPAGLDLSLLNQLSGVQAHVESDGSVLFSGVASGAIDLGGGMLTAIGTSDVVVVEFDSSGQHVWSHRFEADGASAALISNAFGLSDGGAIATGSFGYADFGSGPLPQLGSDFRYVVRLDSNGLPVCARAIAGDVTTGPSGELVVSRSGGPIGINGVSLSGGHPYGCDASSPFSTFFTIARLAP